MPQITLVVGSGAPGFKITENQRQTGKKKLWEFCTSNNSLIGCVSGLKIYESINAINGLIIGYHVMILYFVSIQPGGKNDKQQSWKWQ